MGNTKIVDATTNLTSATALGTDFLPVGRSGGTDSMNISLTELQNWLGTVLDKIEEGDSSVEVVDTGTGYVKVVLDGTEVLRYETSRLTPYANNTFDIGTVAKKIKDIHMAGGIELGSDATGDMYYRDASGNLVRLAIGTAGQVLNVSGGLPVWSAAGGSGDSRWVDWDTGTTARASDSTITNGVTILEAGTPIRYRATAGTWRYGIVHSVSGSTHTILGYSCTTSDDDEFQYGTPELVHIDSIVVPGAFGDGNLTASSSAGLLYTDLLMKLHYRWNKPEAYLVGYQCACIAADSSSAPTIQASIDPATGTFVKPFSATSVSTSVTSTSVAASTNYSLVYKSMIDFDVVAGGSGDASDLEVTLMIVMA